MKKMYLFEKKILLFLTFMFDIFTEQEKIWFHSYHFFLETSACQEITFLIRLRELEIIRVGFSNLE